MSISRTTTTRRFSNGSRILAVGAAFALLAACGTDDGTTAGGDDNADGTTATAEGGNGNDGDDGGNGDDNSFATAQLEGPGGEDHGTVRFSEEDGATVVSVEATGLTEGFLGFHIHEAGVCEADSTAPDDPADRGDFLSAGGHLPGDGEDHPDHAGDLPPLLVDADGNATMTVRSDRLDRETLFDDDGASVMIHADPDNLAHIPERYAPDGADSQTLNAGDGGDRIACGVISEEG